MPPKLDFIEVEARHKGARKRAVMSLEAVEALMEISRQREPCTCLGQRHDFLGNCPRCGRIQCEQEGRGPCFTCGFDTLSDQSSGVTRIDSEDLEAATSFRERLLDYQRDSRRRTAIHDDQADVLSSVSVWASAEDQATAAEFLKQSADVERVFGADGSVVMSSVNRLVPRIQKSAPPKIVPDAVLQDIEVPTFLYVPIHRISYKKARKVQQRFPVQHNEYEI